MADNKPPVVSADTDISPKKQRKTKELKPMSAAEVVILANNLSLSDRALVVKEIERSVKDEIATLRKIAESAESMIDSN